MLKLKKALYLIVFYLSCLLSEFTYAQQTNDDSQLKLWYNKPAVEWVEALPIGNGRIGAMVFGGVPDERIQFNDDTFWSGHEYDPTNNEAYDNLLKVRKLINEGRYQEAQDLANEKMMGNPVDLYTYQPLGDLRMHFPDSNNVSNYKRELDLNTALVKVQYDIDDVTYYREVFASNPDQLIIIRLSSSKKNKISVEAYFDSKQTHIVRHSSDQIIMNGKWNATTDEIRDNLDKADSVNKFWNNDGISFQTNLKYNVVNGSVDMLDNKIKISEADEVIFYLAVSTNYMGQSPSERCDKFLLSSSNSYSSLLQRHIDDYKNLFERVSINLGTNEFRNLPTDKRLLNVSNGNFDPSLISLYFQFGRYLLISSSRPGTQTANLQGIWNDELQPAWGSKYTININIEMNYWPAEVTNLSECHLPLFDLIESLREPGRKTARVHYNCGGFVAHHNTDLWRATTPVDGARWGLWPMGAAWLCTHIFDHYEYTGDKEFLSKHFGAMKESAEFLLNFLIRDEKGRLVTNPSHSPENQFIDSLGNFGVLCVGATMDFEIIYLLFTDIIKASEILDRDKEFAELLQTTLAQIPKIQIGRYGQVQEWLEDYEEAEPGHRHVSHLFALFPSDQINFYKTPELIDAAKVTLERRLSQGGGHTGWSRAWIINLWARLQDSQKAFENVQALLGKSTLHNLFDNHPPFQIDGNFGGTRGIAEMLMQSYNNQIVLLPALPDEWADGSISGIVAKGGFEIVIEWKDKMLRKAEIFSRNGEECKVRYKEKLITFMTEKNRKYNLAQLLGLK